MRVVFACVLHYKYAANCFLTDFWIKLWQLYTLYTKPNLTIYNLVICT